MDKTKYQKHLKAYETFFLAQEEDRDKDTNATIPSIHDVEEVKDWGEHNKK